jgi:2,3-bisphosphoglycerate-dependent phosphoglycerate mutase
VTKTCSPDSNSLPGSCATPQRSVFYLIRHAHAKWTPDEERPLSAQGMRDAIGVADALRAMSISRIVSSPYRRAVQTVQPLAERLNLAIEIEPDLRERSLGTPEPGTDFVSAVEATWSDPSFAYPGGESNETAQRRAVAVVRRLLRAHAGRHIALSTHGNLLALLVQYFDRRVGFDFWRALSTPDIFALRLDDGRVSLNRLWDG